MQSSCCSLKKQFQDSLDSHCGMQPWQWDCRENEDIDTSFSLGCIENDEKQLKELLSLFFSLSWAWKFGSCGTAEDLSVSGSMQLQSEPIGKMNKRFRMSRSSHHYRIALNYYKVDRNIQANAIAMFSLNYTAKKVTDTCNFDFQNKQIKSWESQFELVCTRPNILWRVCSSCHWEPCESIGLQAIFSLGICPPSTRKKFAA